MKLKIEIEAHEGKTKKEYILEASDGGEFSGELARIERERVSETGILTFTSTAYFIRRFDKQREPSI